MAVLEQIDRNSTRAEPQIWLRRVVLYDSLDPLTEIRKIELGTGINIVWGMESDSADAELQPGHGVGKTTFCRLIRYCLGELTFGQENASHEIRHTFPDGYVAAELRLAGEDWAVLRPFGHHRASYAAASVSIDELIADKPTRQSYPDFVDVLAARCLEGIRSDSVLTGGASIVWGHLLAMCARDQEARYQSIWNWRSPRSSSSTPRFQQPRVDALLCLRSVLGLLPDEETTLQQRLQSLVSQLASVEQDIAERRREPDYWVRHLRRGLKDDHGIENADVATLDADDMFGLPKLVDRRVTELEEARDSASEALTTLERQISLASAALQEPAELQEEEAAAADATDDGTETILKTVREIRELRQSIADAEYALCKYGQIAIGQCSYAQQQLADADEQLRETQQEQLPRAAEREQISAALRERAERKAERSKQLREQLDELHKQRNSLNDTRRNATNQIASLRKTLQRLIEWEAIRSGQKADSELATQIGRQQALTTQHDEARERLATLLAEQDERIVGLRETYEALVKATLSPDFKGRVRLSRDGLQFQVFRGENLSGEAFETLSILLADLAVLLMGALGVARHPGLLIHDSPREADLGSAIYRRLLLCVAEVAAEIQAAETPFQYIVTTTTPPPSQLRKKATTRLRLGGDHGPLFGKQLQTEPFDPQQSLLPDDEGE